MSPYTCLVIHGCYNAWSAVYLEMFCKLLKLKPIRRLNAH